MHGPAGVQWGPTRNGKGSADSHGTRLEFHMRSSRFSLFAVAALVAVGAAAHAVATTVVDSAVATYRTFRRHLGLGISMLAAPQVGVVTPTSKPSVVLVAAKEFLAKQMQRSRPTVTPRWRMCPSA